jgi:hypothetical protein
MLHLCLLVAAVVFNSVTVYAFPNTPFYTDGRWIKDSSGAIFTHVGVNWPGHIDCMLPEGLQYQSISTIVSQIKSSGFNVIRFTFSIEMIDQIYENNGEDVPISTTLINALGSQNGTIIFNDILANNPSFSENTTHLQVRGRCQRMWTSLNPINNLRCLMLWRPNATTKKFTSIWTTTCQQRSGAAPSPMAMDGMVTLTSTSLIGHEVTHIWSLMCVILSLTDNVLTNVYRPRIGPISLALGSAMSHDFHSTTLKSLRRTTGRLGMTTWS